MDNIGDRIKALGEFHKQLDRWCELKGSLYDAKVTAKYGDEPIDFEYETRKLKRKCDELENKLKPYREDMLDNIEEFINDLFSGLIKDKD